MPSEVWGALDVRLGGRLDAAVSTKLDADLDWVVQNTKAPGVTAAIGIPGKGVWSGQRGLLLTEPRTPLPPDVTLQQIGSTIHARTTDAWFTQFASTPVSR